MDTSAVDQYAYSVNMPAASTDHECNFCSGNHTRILTEHQTSTTTDQPSFKGTSCMHLFRAGMRECAVRRT